MASMKVLFNIAWKHNQFCCLKTTKIIKKIIKKLYLLVQKALFLTPTLVQSYSNAFKGLDCVWISILSQSKTMRVFQTEAIAGNQYCFNGLGNWSTTNRLGEL